MYVCAYTHMHTHACAHIYKHTLDFSRQGLSGACSVDQTDLKFTEIVCLLRARIKDMHHYCPNCVYIYKTLLSEASYLSSLEHVCSP